MMDHLAQCNGGGGKAQQTALAVVGVGGVVDEILAQHRYQHLP